MEIVTSVKYNDNELSSPNSFKYDGDILKQFAEKYDLKLHIYSKKSSMELDAPDKVVVDTPNLRVVEIPDIGRCDYAFLRHIVQNYDALPEHLYFTKSNINDRILDDSVNYKLFLYKYKYLNVGLHLKLQIYGKTPDFTDLPDVLPEDIEDQSNSYKKNMVNCPIKAYCVMDFFEMVFGDGATLPDTWVNVEFGHGPCFRVCRELILRHPKCVYEKLLDAFSPNKGHWDADTDIPMVEQMDTVGKIYHDALLRLWTLLFTYGTYMPCETDFDSVIGYFDAN